MRGVDAILDRLTRREGAVVGGTALLAVLVTAGLLLAPTGGFVAGTALLALLVVRLAAALLSLATGREWTGRPAAGAWRFLGTGWLLASVSASLLWAAWAFRSGPLGSPSLADLLGLAAYCSFLWAVGSAPLGPPERFGRLRAWLDVAILVLAVIGLTWLAFVEPILKIDLASDIEIFWVALWPALDLTFLALTARLLLVARATALRKAMALLLGAGLAALAADLSAGYLTLLAEAGTPAVTWGLRLLAPVFGGWAALEALKISSEESAFARQARSEALLPIAFTYAVVGYTLVDGWLEGAVNPTGLALSVALTLLVFARQGVVAGQSEMRQYAALVEGAADMAFIVQPDGRVAFANPAFERALRRKPVRKGELHLRDLLGADFDLDPVLAQAAERGWDSDVSFHREDGRSFPVRLTLRPVTLERQRPLLAATAVDLTLIVERESLLRSALDDVAGARADLETLNQDLERKVEARTEELRRMVDDLDRLNRELLALDRVKTEFVELVSHELRAPLTNIRTGIELLINQPTGIPRNARESLGLILEETERLGGFVEAILDLSALEAGRFPLHLETVDLVAAASSASDLFRSGGDAALIHVRLPADLPAAFADERAVASVLHHLLDNAIKYGGGTPVEIRGEPAGDRILFDVIDHGPGIPQAERERVFDRFHRLDSSDSREVYGHGLGLYLVRRLLEAMGGGIRAEAAAGGGARMHCWLRRADSLEEPLESARAAPGPAE
jgi:signal transduction histidine kinase